MRTVRQEAPGRAEGETVYTVTLLTRRIKQAVESSVGRVWVEGEISNLRRPASGHLYFTLKDENAQLTAVWFRGAQQGAAVRPADGMLVRVYGEITVYERGGNYQVLVRLMEEAGLGTLQARFEALKKRLAAEGLFEAARKRPLPLLPRCVGVVTSPTGAAVRDILNVLGRRFPNLHVVIAPARVQGEGAAAEIAAAIALLNARGEADVMIVGRGGGSLEDLWCFNEEVVARAIAASRIPVISAVGHEIDFTISDFTADLRAPTPSAAAELVVGRKDAFEERLAGYARELESRLRERLLRWRHRYEAAAGSYAFRAPANVLRQYAQRLDAAELRLGHGPQQRLNRVVRVLEDARRRLGHAAERNVDRQREAARRLALQLRALNPLAVLERGYSVTRGDDGRVLKRAGDVRAGERLTTRVADGTFTSTAD